MFVDLHQCLNGSVSNLRVLITKQSNYWLNECFQRQRLCAIPKKKKKTKSIFQTIAALVYWEQFRLRCIAIVANMRLGLICFSCSYSQICDCSWCESRPRKSRIVFAHLRCKIYQLSSSFCFNKIQRREEKKKRNKIYITHSFNVLTIVCRNSSRTLAFLCLKHGVNLSSSVCGNSTRLSINLCSTNWAFSRTVSRLSPNRSTTCGNTVGVYALKSWPKRPINSVNDSSARWAICKLWRNETNRIKKKLIISVESLLLAHVYV